MEGTQKCLYKDSDEEGYKLVHLPIPKPGPGEVLVKVLKVGICGSDITLWKWNEAAKAIANIPFIPGHEMAGEVVMVGDEVTTVAVGQRIAVENHFYCGDCLICKNGRPDICRNMSQYGHGKGTTQGGCSEYSVVPARYCYVLTTDLTDSQACVLEPMGVAHNAVTQISVKGQAVLVLGAGPIGLFAVAIAKSFGASSVVCVDINAERLQAAKKMGADVVVNPLEEKIEDCVRTITNGNMFPRIVEVSGAAILINSCFSWLQKGGQIVLVGLPKAPIHIENPIENVLLKSLTVISIYGRRIFSTWEACEYLLHTGQVDASPVISHEMAMSEYKEAFSLLTSGKAKKILMVPSK